MFASAQNPNNMMGRGLQFDIRPFSAFKFGGRNRRPKAENVRFQPKISASGILLQKFPAAGRKFIKKFLQLLEARPETT